MTFSVFDHLKILDPPPYTSFADSALILFMALFSELSPTDELLLVVRCTHLPFHSLYAVSKGRVRIDAGRQVFVLYSSGDDFELTPKASAMLTPRFQRRLPV